MRYSWIVYSSPVKGRETAYNEWYDKQHLPDLLKIPGVTSARRYRIAKDQRGGPEALDGRQYFLTVRHHTDLHTCRAEVVGDQRGNFCFVFGDEDVRWHDDYGTRSS